MELVPISLNSKLNAAFEENADCKEYLQMTIDFFHRVGYDPPWIGYYARLNNEFVGAERLKESRKIKRWKLLMEHFANMKAGELEQKFAGNWYCYHLRLTRE